MDLAAFGLLDSIWWRGSWRALEDASQDSSRENSTNAGLVFRPGNKLQPSCSYGNITVRQMSRVPVSKSGIRPVTRKASMERHTQRFLELRRGLEQIESAAISSFDFVAMRLKRTISTPDPFALGCS